MSSNYNFSDIDADIMTGPGGMVVERRLINVVNFLKNKARTKEDLLKEGADADITEKDLEKAINQGVVCEWPIFLDDPLYYVEGRASEAQVEGAIVNWMELSNLDKIFMEAMKSRKIFLTRASDMLEFLQIYDKGIDQKRNGKIIERGKIKLWTPITFYEMLATHYERGSYGELEDIATLLNIVEEAKVSPIDELDVEIADAKKLVDLNLLTLVDKKTGLYRYGYCAFLDSYFREHEIDPVDILNKDLSKLSEDHIKILKQSDLLDENSKLSKKGEIVIEYLCQCGIDPRNRMEELKKITKIWKDKSGKIINNPMESARYMLKAARLEKKLKVKNYKDTTLKAVQIFSDRIPDNMKSSFHLSDTRKFAIMYGRSEGLLGEKPFRQSGRRSCGYQESLSAEIDYLEDMINTFEKNETQAFTGSLCCLIADKMKLSDKHDLIDIRKMYKKGAVNMGRADNLFAATEMIKLGDGYLQGEEYNILKRAHEMYKEHSGKKGKIVRGIFEDTYGLDELVDIRNQARTERRKLSARKPDYSFKKKKFWKDMADKHEKLSNVYEVIHTVDIFRRYGKPKNVINRLTEEKALEIFLDGDYYDTLKKISDNIKIHQSKKEKGYEAFNELSDKEYQIVFEAEAVKDSIQSTRNKLGGKMDNLIDEAENRHLLKIYDAKNAYELAASTVKGIKSNKVEYAIVPGLSYKFVK